MSGGSYNYEYQRIREEYVYNIPDKYAQLNEMLKDLCDLLHDLEWWKSGDTSQGNFEKSYNEFCKRWFGKSYVDGYNSAIEMLESHLSKIIKLKK